MHDNEKKFFALAEKAPVPWGKIVIGVVAASIILPVAFMALFKRGHQEGPPPFNQTYVHNTPVPTPTLAPIPVEPPTVVAEKPPAPPPGFSLPTNTEVAPTLPAPSIKIETLCNAYLDNKISAERRFKGTRVNINGTLLNQGEWTADTNENLVTVLVTENKKFLVSLLFNASKVNEVLALKQEDQLQMSGIVGNVTTIPAKREVYVTIDNAELVKVIPALAVSTAPVIETTTIAPKPVSEEQRQHAAEAVVGTVSIFFLVMCVVGFLLYWLPSIIASSRKHKNTGAIACLNIFLGWTFIGWVVAMIWAHTDNVKE